MKKIILVLAIAFVGCSQPEDLPIPIDPVDPIVVVTQSVPNSHNFEGTWICEDWLVDEITGAIRKREFIFSDQSDSTVYLRLNNYELNGSVTALITFSIAGIDSNYFYNPAAPQPVKFKGVMTTDSTLMVYEYYTSGSTIDTSQVKEFKR